MSSDTPHITVSLRGRARGRPSTAVRLRARADVAAPALVAVAFVVLAAITWAAWGDLAHDTGYDFVAADRIVHGQLPYSDFPYAYGPLGVGLLGGAFALLGTNIGAAIALGLVLAAAVVAATYLLARTLTGPTGAALAALLALPAALGTGNIGLVLPHSFSASVAVLGSLAGLLAAAAAARAGTRARVALAGLALGTVALSRPEFVAALAGALSLWLGLRIHRAAGAERRRALGDAAVCATVAAAIPLAVYGAFAAAVGAGELLGDLFPSAQLAAGGRALLRNAAPLTAASFAKLAGDLVLYAGGVAALLGAGALWARGGRARRVVLGAAIVAGVAWVAALAGDHEAVRSKLAYAYLWIPAGAAVALAALLRQAWLRARPWTARDQTALLVSAFLAVLAAKTYGAFRPQPNPDFAQYATYALPFAAVFLVWFHIELLGRWRPTAGALGAWWLGALALAGFTLVALDARDESATVRGPGGSLAAPSDQARAYQLAVDQILARTRPGDPILLAPQLTALYTIANRRDPLPEISLLPGALPTPADEDAAIRRLGEVRVAVVDLRPLSEYGQGAFGVTFDRRLGAWLRHEFRHVATLRGAAGTTLDVLARTPPRRE